MTPTNRAFLLTLPFLFVAMTAAGACSDSNDPAVTDTDTDSMLMGGSSSEPDTSEPDTSEPAASEPDTSEPDSTDPSDLTLGEPPCSLNPTTAGVEPKKNEACTEDDVQLCWRSCGPESIGWKTETCTAGVYAEGDCQFDPEDDYSCFAIPDEIDASCPTDVPPKATDECDIAECTLCNVDGHFYDSQENDKTGYCVCVPATDDKPAVWSCSSATAWPCPLGMGC